MSDAIKTSVIIPVYNTAEYLEECIESVLAQTQKEIEIFLIDDGSTDGSLEIIDRYVSNYPFIYKLTQQHEYQGTARNRGFEKARGKYIYFMDSDDAILPELFDTCYELCERMDLDFAAFDAYGFRYDENDAELKVPDDIFDRTTLGIEERIYTGPEFWNNFYNHHGILYLCWLHYIRRDYIIKNKLLFEEHTYFEDNDWTLRMYMHAERLYFIHKQLHRHRWRRNSNMLGGFTVELMEGCFRMHHVLLELYSSYPREDLNKMISDVIRLNICRFDRLAEVDPQKGYIVPLEAFCRELGTIIENSAENDRFFYVHFAALERILFAVRAWNIGAFDDLGKIIRSSLDKHFPQLWQDKRIAVYGTGKVSTALVQLLDEYAKDKRCDLIFIHSKLQTGSDFRGYKVYNVKDAAAQHPDVVIIGSIIYRDSILRTLKENIEEDIQTFCLPQEIRFLQDNNNDLAEARR